MTFLVDSRVGSKDLVAWFQKLGHAAEPYLLEAGDVVFMGYGPDRTVAEIAVEVKRIPDLIGSVKTGRLAGFQVPRLVAASPFPFLIIEGIVRCGQQGQLIHHYHGQWAPIYLGTEPLSWTTFVKARTSLMLQGELLVLQTGTREETARTIIALGEWFSEPWFSHKTVKQWHRARGPFLNPPLRQRVAAELPMIGWERSRAVLKAFASTRAMINAEASAWRALPGVGAIIATRIDETLDRE